MSSIYDYYLNYLYFLFEMRIKVYVHPDIDN